MILKAVRKFTIFEKMNIKVVTPIFILIQRLDDIFLTVRIFLVCNFLSKNKRITNALRDVNKNGVGIISNFYNEEKIEELNRECSKMIDSIPVEKFINRHEIQQEPISIDDKQIYIEKFGPSTKIKFLKNFNNFFNMITKNPEIALINKVYHLNFFYGPEIFYHHSNDGSSNHPIFKSNEDKREISSLKLDKKDQTQRPHIDLYLHRLRAFIALNDVDISNGGTSYYEKSHKAKCLKTSSKNLFLQDFKFDTKTQDHYVSEDLMKEVSQESKKLDIKCKKGDLVLMDLKTVHHANRVIKGERKILWFYY